MDRMHELVAPLMIADRHNEARRAALAEMAHAASANQHPLASYLGALLIQLGCRLAVDRRRATTLSPALEANPCGC